MSWSVGKHLEKLFLGFICLHFSRSQSFTGFICSVFTWCFLVQLDGWHWTVSQHPSAHATSISNLKGYGEQTNKKIQFLYYVAKRPQHKWECPRCRYAWQFQMAPMWPCLVSGLPLCPSAGPMLVRITGCCYCCTPPWFHKESTTFSTHTSFPAVENFHHQQCMLQIHTTATQGFPNNYQW